MAQPPRSVLIVDDSLEDCVSIRRRLERDRAGYCCSEAHTAAAAREHCRAGMPAVILLDYGLPDCDGLVLLAELLDTHGPHAAAILMLTGIGNQAIAVQAMKLGAHDYLIKGPELDLQLGRAVAGAIEKVDMQRRVASLLRDLESNNQQLRQAAVEMRAREAFNQAVLNSIGAHIAVLDRSGTIIAVNSAWEHFARENGRADNAVDIGVNYLAVCRAGAAAGLPEAELVHAGIEHVLNGLRQDFVLEYPCGSQDEQHWFVMNVTPLRAPPGGAVVSHRTITQRKRAEAALQTQNELLREQAALLDQAHVLVRDANNRIVFWNAGAQALYGWTADEAVGQLSHQLLQTEFPVSFEAYQEQLCGAGHWAGELVHTKRDGSQVVVASHQVLHQYGPGRTYKILEVNNDITERRRVEQALRESQRQLHGLSVRLVNAQEDERRALSYELHDEIGQQLTGLNMVLEAGADASLGYIHAKLRSAQQMVTDLTSRVRQLSLDLRPPMLDDFGLLSTLIWHIQRYSEQTQIAIDFKHGGFGATIAPHVAIAAYRIMQEGLTNIARHACVGEAVVRVWLNDGQLKIAIEDRGCGFDLAAVLRAPRSVGLSGMRERAQLLGGHFTIDAAPGEGTRIFASIPLDAAPEAQQEAT